MFIGIVVLFVLEDWTDGAGTSAGGDGWNAGGSSGER